MSSVMFKLVMVWSTAAGTSLGSKGDTARWYRFEASQDALLKIGAC